MKIGLMRLLLLLVLLARPAAGAEEPAAGTGRIRFSFDQVELRMLVRTVGEVTGRRFALDDAVSGKVTVISPTPVAVADVYPMFLSILESAGFTVVEKAGLCHIVPAKERGLLGAPVVTGSLSNQHGLITKIIPVRNISALELKRVLETLVRGGREGAVAAIGSTNHLLITDTVENIRQLELIIADLDRPGASRVVEVVPLKNGTATDVARQLVAAMGGAASAGSQVGRHLQQVAEGAASLPADMVVVPAPQANSLILVGTAVQLQEMKAVIEKMDLASPSGYSRMNAIFLKYLTAEDAAKNLNALLAKTVGKDERNSIAIEPNAANNALIVDAAPQDFDVVKKLVDELDRIPQQVLVEVVIAEVSVEQGRELGTELSTIDLPADGDTAVVGRSRPGETDTLLDIVQNSVYPQGLAFGIARGSSTLADGTLVPDIPLLIKALAQSRDVKILSSVPLLAQNNTEASVNVVDNIPIRKSTIEGGTGSSRDIIQNIERIDVGIKLKLTPHVNPDGQVLLKLNPSIEAITDNGPADQPFTPTIAKREVSTTVTVPDQATVVISGLMREDDIKQVSKVPFLGDIPLLGWLFRSETTQKKRTNLLIFVTPHIVTDAREGARMRKAMEDRANLRPPALELDPAEPVPVGR